MTELRELRPYLDLLVDDALAYATSVPRPNPRRAFSRRRWVVAVAAAVVAVVIVAVVLVRSTTTSNRSVQVPPAQQPRTGPVESREQECLGTAAPDTVNSYFDHATGQSVQMTAAEWCRQYVLVQPYDSRELQRAGVNATSGMENGHPKIVYVEIVDVGSGIVLTNIEVPADEVGRRIAALRNGVSPRPADAEQALGFTVRRPTYMPDGWKRVNEELRAYPGVDSVDPSRVVYLYHQAWAPVATQSELQQMPNPTYVMLRQRLAGMPGDVNTCDGGLRAVLDDGSVLCGTGTFTWVKDGVWYSLSGANVADDELVRIANSLR